MRVGLGSPTFTWKGAAIPCVPNTLGVGSILEAGGFDMNITLTLYVQRSEFLSVDSTLISVDSEAYTMDNDKPTPMSGKTIGYNGATYRIERTRFSPCGSFLSILCADKNR